MARISVDIERAYQKQFGKKPVINNDLLQVPVEDSGTVDGEKPESVLESGSLLTTDYRGREIWLPITFYDLDISKFGVSEILIPYATIKLSARKTIVKTPMVERQGTVHEQYSVEDYDISIKGFLIGYDSSGKYPAWPESDIKVLKELFMLNESIRLDNALTNIFMNSNSRVIIESIDFPEVEGGRKNYRPFSMKLSSDSVFTLELE